MQSLKEFPSKMENELHVWGRPKKLHCSQIIIY